MLRAKESPEIATAGHDEVMMSHDVGGARRKIKMEEPQRPVPKIADFVSANRDLDCESIDSDMNESSKRDKFGFISPKRNDYEKGDPPSGQFDVISSYSQHKQDSELDEFERLEQELAQR